MNDILVAVIIVLGVLLLIDFGYFFYSTSKSSKIVNNTYTGNFTFGEDNKEKIKVLVDGDSIGAGIGATSLENSVGGRIGSFLGESYNVELENMATSGDKIEDLLNRKITKNNLSVLFITSNNVMRFKSFSDLRENSKKVFKKYSNKSNNVIVAGPGKIHESTAFPVITKPFYLFYQKKYAEILEEESSKFDNVYYIDPLSIDFESGPHTESVDNLHPNDKGHEQWFLTIKNKIESENIITL